MNRKELQSKVEEFIANGGKVTVYPTVKPEEVKQLVNAPTGGPAHLMSLADGDLFFGQTRKRKPTKMKRSEPIDWSVLPDSLKKKYMAE